MVVCHKVETKIDTRERVFSDVREDEDAQKKDNVNERDIRTMKDEIR